MSQETVYQTIPQIIQWLNANDGFVMALLTVVYVFATILICIFNYKSASAAKKQTVESIRQFEESNRAYVIPKFETLEGQLYCLVFQNIGKTIAEKLTIKVSEEWLDCLRRTEKNPMVANTLSNLGKIEIFLPAGDKYMYSICVLNDKTGDFSILCEKPLKISISYLSGNKPHSEEYELNLKGINCISNTSDYVRMEQKKKESIDNLTKQIITLVKK